MHHTPPLPPSCNPQPSAATHRHLPRSNRPSHQPSPEEMAGKKGAGRLNRSRAAEEMPGRARATDDSVASQHSTRGGTDKAIGSEHAAPANTRAEEGDDAAITTSGACPSQGADAAGHTASAPGASKRSNSTGQREGAVGAGIASGQVPGQTGNAPGVASGGTGGAAGLHFSGTFRCSSR